jgi:hypothetical protein
MNLPAQLGPELLLLLLLLFSILWCGIVAFISFIGGWHQLAKSFRAEEKVFRVTKGDQGERFRCASMTMGPKYFPTNYGNCLTIRVSCEGIGITVWPLFRCLHPTLWIRWPHVERCERGKYLLVFSRTAAYLSNRHPLCFYGRAGKAIYNAWLQRVGADASEIHAIS